MSLSESHRLEKEILETFPSEKLEYYLTSKRGKLYNKYYNLSAGYKTISKPLQSVKKSDNKIGKSHGRHEKIFVFSEPEVDAESCIRALKFDNLSVEEFDRTWKACRQSRLHFIRKSTSTSEVIEKCPYYKNPSGYRLIDFDFEAAFDADNNSLLNKWQAKYPAILSFLSMENNVKDKSVKAILEKLRNNLEMVPENGQDAALILALHGYFVPTGKVVKVDPNTRKKETTKYTIKDSQESFLFIGANHQHVEEQIHHAKKNKMSVQPSIYCIADDIFDIKEIFIHFDDIRYKFKNVSSQYLF